VPVEPIDLLDDRFNEGMERLEHLNLIVAAVVNATVNPFWQAARPSARATRVLPVPLSPPKVH